jgi:16S rRNA (adenine1518-N6/adenine1519-N6)-dimethyltransferase
MTKKAISKKPVFAKKSFGQNFLVDENYIAKIIFALNIQPDETIIEIGAGRGALTEKLIESGAKIVAIELERDMIVVLRERFSGCENFQLIEADALKIDFIELINLQSQIPNPKSVKLVANLPYYISTAILQKLIEQREVFSEMVLMFQREVVERIAADVGSSERGFLTVMTEAYLDSEKLFDVPPWAFRPSPKVNSAVVRLKPKIRNLNIDSELFRTVVSAAFVQKRKTIYNNLKNTRLKNSDEIDWLKLLNAAEIEPARRAENLRLEEWEKLVSTLL